MSLDVTKKDTYLQLQSFTLTLTTTDNSWFEQEARQ